MKKLFSYTLLLMTLGFMSCSPSPVGTWVEPTGGTEPIGFTLYKDGSASSLNMGYVKFNAWEQNGDLLILKGNYAGRTKREFSDTMKIESLTKTELILSQANDSVFYIRK